MTERLCLQFRRALEDRTLRARRIVFAPQQSSTWSRRRMITEDALVAYISLCGASKAAVDAYLGAYSDLPDLQNLKLSTCTP